MADKLCALVETHDGRASSRVKDLVDIVICATTCLIGGEKLQQRLRRETAIRKIVLSRSFEVPESWDESHKRQFEKLCIQTGLPDSLKTLGAATQLARELFNPALAGIADGMTWNPSTTTWEEKKLL